MAVYKNNDNFDNTKQFILEQLFPYNYNNDNDFNILKKKIWILDGKITDEEKDAGYDEDDIDNPKNHFASILNELTFLDRYIRTKEDNLGDDPSFEELKALREQAYETWINTEDPETGETYEGYEMPYQIRPTLLSDSDFEELYQEFTNKRSNGELDKAEDIINKVTDYCIDDQKKNQETAIQNTKSPSEIEEDIKEQAEAKAKDNDRNYVYGMNNNYDEMFEIVLSVEPTTEDSTAEVNVEKILVNVPHKRQNVSLDDTSTHKGLIPAGGGYKFSYKDINGNDVSLTIDNNSVSTDKTGNLEWSYNDWLYAKYYEDADTGESYLEPSDVDKNSLPSESGTALEKGAKTIERFNELNKQWENINRLREDEVQNIGTRSKLESMVTADIPDVKSDLEDHFEDRKNQKVNYTRYLIANTSEFG